MADRFQKFTDRAQQALSIAQHEAQRLHHKYIGTEHLMLGLLHDDESAAGQILRNLGASLPSARTAVESMIGQSESTAGPDQIGLTPRAKQVIELAVDEARRLQSPSIGTQHLLLGLIREGQGVGAGILQSLGVSLEQVRDEAGQAAPDRPLPGGGPSHRQSISGSAWVQTSATTGSGATSTFGGPSSSGPRLRDLLRVIPVAQSHTVDGVTVTLLSIETYADGFVATFRVIAEPAPSGHRFPQLVLEITDDQGNRYNGWPGGGVGDYEQWRLIHRFAPALAPNAQELHLDVTDVRWRTPGNQPEEKAEVGPWAFAVPIPGDTLPIANG